MTGNQETIDETRAANKARLVDLKRTKKVDLAELTSTAKETAWVAADFKSDVLKYKKYQLPSNTEVIGHCIRFWTWYGGIEGAPTKLDMMFCGVLSRVTVGGNSILHKDLIGDEPVVPETAAETSAVGYKFYSISSSMMASKSFVSSKGTISADQCVIWINAILKALRNSELGAKEETQVEFTCLVRLTGLVMLNCCRLATKDPQSVQEHIVLTIIERASSLFAISMSHYSTCQMFAPPCHDFMVTFTELIKKGVDMSKQVLGRIIFSHVYAEKESESVRAVFRTGCLLSLSYTGLSPVSWLVKAAKAKKTSQVELLSQLYIPRMESFITKYLKLADEPDSSWIYCRLMNESAHLGLSANTEPLATAVFVALCYNPKNPDMTVWSIPSLACITYDDIIRAHCIAEALMDTETCLSKEEAVVDEALPLVAALRSDAKECYSKYQEKFGPLFKVENRSIYGRVVPPEEEVAEEEDSKDKDDQGSEGGGDDAPAAGPSTGVISDAAAFAARFGMPPKK